VATVVTQPLEVLKTRYIYEGKAGTVYPFGIIPSLLIIAKEEGFYGLFSGLPFMLCYSILGHTLVRALHSRRTASKLILARTFTELAINLLLQPFTFANRCMQIDSPRFPKLFHKFNGFWDCILQVYKKHGLVVFFNTSLVQFLVVNRLYSYIIYEIFMNTPGTKEIEVRCYI